MPRSHSQELLASPRLRKACDRCHSQKQRCIQLGGNSECIRCVKSGAICVFSHRNARNTPRTSNDIPLQREHGSQSAHEQLADMQAVTDPAEEVTIGTFTLDALFDLNGSNESTVETIFRDNSTAQGSNHGCYEREDQHFTKDLVRQLAALNVEIYDNGSTLPPLPGAGTDHKPPSATAPTVFALDNTLSLTRQFISTLHEKRAATTANYRPTRNMRTKAHHQTSPRPVHSPWNLHSSPTRSFPFLPRTCQMLQLVRQT